MAEDVAQSVPLSTSHAAAGVGAAESRDALNKAAWHGSAITVMGQGVSAVVRLGSNLIITGLRRMTAGVLDNPGLGEIVGDR